MGYIHPKYLMQINRFADLQPENKQDRAQKILVEYYKTGAQQRIISEKLNIPINEVSETITAFLKSIEK